MPKNKKIYKQYDSKWANLPYPTKASSFSGNACGCCSVLHCIIEMDKYKNYTPKDIQPYMKQHAVVNQGTSWNGIPTALKHYGLKNVKELDTMTELWKEMKKGSRVCVLLFKGGSAPNGTVWTGGGHYVACTDYKTADGNHKLYVKDSGPRDHDGWYTYEKSMKGLISKIWVGTLPTEKKEETKTTTSSSTSTKTTTTTTTTAKTTETKTEAKVETAKEETKTTCTTSKTPKADALVATAKALCHKAGTDKEKWEYKTGAPTTAFRAASKKYTEKTSKISLSDCGNFINVVVRKAGVDSKFKALNDTKDPFPTSKKFKRIQKGKKITSSKAKPGDIIRYKSKTGQHTLMYMGNGYIAEAGRGKRFPVIRKSTKYNGSSVKIDTLELLRVIE